MIEAARSNCPNLDFSVSDILDFTPESRSFGLILLMGIVLDYLNPIERRSVILSRCEDWLEPGGAVIGSSHVTKPGQRRGYYAENYHGAQVENLRSPLAEIIEG